MILMTLVQVGIYSMVFYAVASWRPYVVNTVHTPIRNLLKQLGLFMSGYLRTSSYESVFLLAGIVGISVVLWI